MAVSSGKCGIHVPYLIRYEAINAYILSIHGRSQMDGRDGGQCRPERRLPAPRRKFAPIIVTAATLSISGLPFMGALPVQAVETTFQCVNPASGTLWNLKIDDERQ